MIAKIIILFCRNVPGSALTEEDDLVCPLRKDYFKFMYYNLLKNGKICKNRIKV